MRVKLRNRQIKITLLIVLFILLNFIGEEITNYEFGMFMEGNQKIIGDMHFRDKINDLQNEVLLIESRIRGLVVTGKPEFALNIEVEFERAFADLTEIIDDTSTKPELAGLGDSLNLMVRNKIAFNKQIIALFHQHGKLAAEQHIATGAGKKLREDILEITSQLNTYKLHEIQMLERQVTAQGIRTKTLEDIFPVLSTLFISILAIMLIRNIRRQEHLVKESNVSLEKQRRAYFAKDQFISNISHEIRTPLNSVIGYSNLLLKTELNQTQKKFLDAIQASGSNLLHIINELLDFGKIQEGTLVLKKHQFQLQVLLSEVSSMFAEAFSKKNVLFQLNIGSDVPQELIGDDTKFRQVIVNLINNAHKFTNRGEVTITVSLKVKFANQVKINVDISDTGIGIAKEHLPRIFERFYQVDANPDRKFGGTGLGLSITHQLVTLMGGEISVVSEEGKGTCFTIEITFDLPDPKSLRSENRTFSIKISHSNSSRVLIVDDNPLNSDLTSYVLQSWNFEVELANNGVQALEKLKQSKFDLVLMDVQMPEMDGYETTKRIRNELRLTVPILALTAYASKEEHYRCLAAGMTDFIAKPFDELALFGLVTKLLSTQMSECFDFSYLRSLSKGNREVEDRILQRFLSETPEQLSRLQRAEQGKDITSIKKILHNLHANISLVGLDKPLRHHLEKVKSFNADSDWSEIHTILKEVNEKLFKCIRLLKEQGDSS